MKNKIIVKKILDNFLIKKEGKSILRNIEKKNLIKDGLIDSLDVLFLASEIAKKTKKHTTTNESSFKRMMNQMNGLNEVSYRDYKKEPTSKPQQKVNRGIIEINKMLGEMERVVNNNIKLKTEMGVQSNHFWKSTGKRFRKINERMIRIANRLREHSQ